MNVRSLVAHTFKHILDTLTEISKKTNNLDTIDTIIL